MLPAAEAAAAASCCCCKLLLLQAAAAASCCCCKLLLLQAAAAASCCCCKLLLLQAAAAAGCLLAGTHGAYTRCSKLLAPLQAADSCCCCKLPACRNAWRLHYMLPPAGAATAAAVPAGCLTHQHCLLPCPEDARSIHPALGARLSLGSVPARQQKKAHACFSDTFMQQACTAIFGNAHWSSTAIASPELQDNTTSAAAQLTATCANHSAAHHHPNVRTQLNRHTHIQPPHLQLGT
jgi:hypothetical protein